MPMPIRDLRGLSFNDLKPQFIVAVIPHKGARWFCLCECGSSHVALAGDLVRKRARCADCARKNRLVQLSEARRQRRLRSTATIYSWEPHRARLGSRQRAQFDSMLSGRRRLGIQITLAIVVETADIAMREATAA